MGLPTFLFDYFILDAHYCFVKDTCIHELKVRRNLRSEIHLSENILFKIHTGRNFHELNSTVYKAEYGTLGDVHHILMIFTSIVRRESNLLNLLNELYLAVSVYLKVGPGALYISFPYSKIAHEENLFGVLRNVYIPAGTNTASTEI